MTLAPSPPAPDALLDRKELDALVRRSRSGDVEAFNLIVQSYYGVTFRMAYRMLGYREAAEDATQEIFFKAWRGLPRFLGASRFNTWLYTIAVNHCLSTARRQNREAERTQPFFPGETDSLYDAPHDPSVLHDSFESDLDLHLAVQDALQRLPEKLRIVVSLHFFAGYSTGEIAAALSLHPNTVRHRLNEAIQRLKRTLTAGEEN